MSGGASRAGASGADPAVERVFLIADVRGYTRFTRERGDAEAARLATRFAELARDAVEARGGQVIELRGDEALAVFDSATGAVRAATELAAVCADEAASPGEPPTVQGNTAALAPDDTRVIVAYQTGQAYVWNIEPDVWKRQACQVAGRNLTRDEWAQFLPNRTYRAVCPGLPSG